MSGTTSGVPRRAGGERAFIGEAAAEEPRTGMATGGPVHGRDMLSNHRERNSAVFDIAFDVGIGW